MVVSVLSLDILRRFVFLFLCMWGFWHLERFGFLWDFSGFPAGFLGGEFAFFLGLSGFGCFGFFGGLFFWSWFGFLFRRWVVGLLMFFGLGFLEAIIFFPLRFLLL